MEASTIWGADRVSAIRVAVIDEHEVFRRGVVASLEEDGDFEVVDSEGPDIE